MSANPYDRLPKLPAFDLESTDVKQGVRLSNDQVGAGAGGVAAAAVADNSAAPAPSSSSSVAMAFLSHFLLPNSVSNKARS